MARHKVTMILDDDDDYDGMMDTLMFQLGAEDIETEEDNTPVRPPTGRRKKPKKEHGSIEIAPELGPLPNHETHRRHTD